MSKFNAIHPYYQPDTKADSSNQTPHQSPLKSPSKPQSEQHDFRLQVAPVATSQDYAKVEIMAKHQHPWSWRKLLTVRNSGIALLLCLILFALMQPYFYPVDYTKQQLSNMLAEPSAEALWGTDHLGRDMLARIAAALRLSLGLVLGCVAIALGAGLVTGFLSGYYGGWIGNIFNLLAYMVMALPGLLLILMFAALAPGSYWSLYLGISLVMWVEFYRVVKAQCTILAHSLPLQNSRLLGMSLTYCFKRHVFPQLAPVVLTMGALNAGNAVLALATLGFCQVGLRPPTPELGLMMTELFPYYYMAPEIFMQPVIAVFLLVLSLQLIARGGKNV